MYKRIFLILIIILILIYFILNKSSYHVSIEYSDVLEISYTQYLGEYKNIKYTDKNEIKNIVKKIKHVNFYYSSMNQLQESPTSSILIKYSNGNEKLIYIAGFNVFITNESKNGDIEEIGFFFINPISIKRIFK